MKRIEYSCSDTEELAEGFKRLAGNLICDAEAAGRAALMDETEQIYTGLKKLLMREAEAAEEAADFLLKFADECESAESRVELMVRKAVFEQRSNVIVEKSKTPVRSSFVSVENVKHDSRLAQLALKEMSGEK